MAHFRNEKLCFQGKILQQIEIRSWSNGVCCSHCISFRWHFWHIYFISNHFIIKNKVLSYHGWNSEKRSTVANYLYFPSNKNKHTFVSLFILRIFRDISNFWKASQPLSKPITTHWILSHMLNWKLLLSNSHTFSYFCGSYCHFLQFNCHCNCIISRRLILWSESLQTKTLYDEEHLQHSMPLSAKTFPNDKVWNN